MNIEKCNETKNSKAKKDYQSEASTSKQNCDSEKSNKTNEECCRGGKKRKPSVPNRISDSKNDTSQTSKQSPQSSKIENQENLQNRLESQIEMLNKQEEILRQVVNHEKEEIRTRKALPCNSCELPNPYEALKTSSLISKWIFGSKNKRNIDLIWLVSAPGNNTADETWNQLNDATSPGKLSVNYKFHIPTFRIGSVDQLMELTDILAGLYKDAKSVVMSLVKATREVTKTDDVHKHLLVKGLDMVTYITRFSWNAAKYPVRKPMKEISEMIEGILGNIESNLKAREEDFMNAKMALSKIKRQQTGNLTTRPLGDMIQKKEVVLDSNILITLLVVMPKTREKKWKKSYETLCDMVVPKSGIKLFENREQCLYKVVVLKKFVQDFKTNAKQEDFMIRDFNADENWEQSADVRERLEKVEKSQVAVLYRWIRINFSESFEALMHVKAMRVFVESVLRYGLPINFQAVCIIPLKATKKLRDCLKDLYQDVECSLSDGKIEDVPRGLIPLDQKHHYRYVFFSIDTGILRHNKSL